MMWRNLSASFRDNDLLIIQRYFYMWITVARLWIGICYYESKQMLPFSLTSQDALPASVAARFGRSFFKEWK
jgi:hypothetical protein